MSDNLSITPVTPSGADNAPHLASRVDLSGLPSLLVDTAHRIIQASPAAERFLLVSGGIDLFATLHPDLCDPLRQLLPVVFERGVRRVSAPVELGPGRPRVVLSVSPYAGADAQPLALILLLVDESGPGLDEPGFWELGPTSQLDPPETMEPSVLDPVVLAANGDGDAGEQISQLQTDNSRLRETEARLRSTADMLDTALEASGMGWITLDVATGEVELDQRARAMTGLADGADTIPAEQWMERVHPDDVPPLLAELEAAEREDRHTFLEYRLQRPDGALRRLRITGTYVRGEDGKVTRWTGLVQDVTEQRALEESLRRQTRMLQLASEASEIGWGAYNPETDLTEWDARGYEIMGFTGSPEDRTQEDFLARIHPDDRERIAAELRQSKTVGGDYRREYRIIRPDGEIREIVGTGTYLVDESGKVTHGTGFLWDVTERKRQERALEERERGLRLAVEAGRLAVWETDVQRGTIRPISSAPGLTLVDEERLDDFVARAIHPDDLEVVAQAATEPPGNLELRALAPDGSYRWVRSSYGEMTHDGSGKPLKVFGVTIDIHDLKESGQELQRQAEMLRLASEAAGIGWSWSDSSAGPTYCDARTMEILGYPREPRAVTQEEFLAQVHPDDRAGYINGFREMGHDGAFHKEYRIIRPDGEVRDVVVDGAFIRDAGGANRGAAMLRDVTEGKAQERAVIDREQRLRLAVQAARLGLWEWEIQTDQVRVLTTLPGISLEAGEDSLERRIALAFHPDDAPAVVAAMRAAAAGGPPFRMQARGKGAAGDLWMWMEGAVTRDETGRPVRMLGVSVNIQAIKESEQALRRQAEMLRLASEAAGLGWATSDSATGLTHWDGRSMAILGRPPLPASLTMEEFFAYIHPDDRERVGGEIQTSNDDSGSFQREYRIVRPDGAVRDIEVRGAYLREDDGVVRGTGLIYDVTERKQQQRELEERERSLRLAIQTTRLRLWEWNPRTDEVRVIASSGNVTPPQPGATLQVRLALIHPDDRDAYRAAAQRAATAAEPLRIEARIEQADGGYRWMRIDGEPILDERGDVLRVIGVTLDIHDQKENELALQRWAETLEQRVRERTQEVQDAYASVQAAHERFHNLFEASPVPTILFRYSDLIVLDANMAFLDYTGVRREELVGRSTAFVETAYQIDKSVPAMREAAREGRVSGFEHQFVHPSGEARTLLISIVPLEIDDEPALLGSFIDITARKLAEEQVRELASQLSMAEQRERHRVSAILHDDLQQRLYALQLQLHWLLEMVQQGDAEAVSAAVDDLLALVPDTIKVTRRLSVDLSPPILQGEGLTEALSWLASQMRDQYGLEIELEAGPRPRLMDEGLRILVFQVLRELLFNVVKHAGVLRVAVKVSKSNDALTVTVHDEGKGFDAAAVLEGHGGDGLGRGLAMNRQRLELVGGRMTVDSSPGAGTTIFITVPLSGAEGDSEGGLATE